MDDNIKFLTALHAVSVKSHENVEFLDTLVNNPLVPHELRLKLVEIQTTLKVQDVIIRALGEHQVDIEDKVSEVLAQLDSKKD